MLGVVMRRVRFAGVRDGGWGSWGVGDREGGCTTLRYTTPSTLYLYPLPSTPKPNYPNNLQLTRYAPPSLPPLHPPDTPGSFLRSAYLDTKLSSKHLHRVMPPPPAQLDQLPPSQPSRSPHRTHVRHGED